LVNEGKILLKNKNKNKNKRADNSRASQEIETQRTENYKEK
jgi:hypothetical protein